MIEQYVQRFTIPVGDVPPLELDATAKVVGVEQSVHGELIVAVLRRRPGPRPLPFTLRVFSDREPIPAAWHHRASAGTLHLFQSMADPWQLST